MSENHYPKLIIMVTLSFIAMYILRYSMVNAFGNIYNNFNQFYMAGLMAAPMMLIELVLMWSMYPNKRLNVLILVVSLVVLLGFFLAIRQPAVSDKQFLRSMIPHHAGAILMCERASIQDPEVQNLCKTIITNQQSEIDQMKGILQRLDK